MIEHPTHQSMRHRHILGFDLYAAALGALALGYTAASHAQANPVAATSAPDGATAQCLPTGDGFLNARLGGAIQAELQWGNQGTQCSGAARPTDGGIRLRFSRADAAGAAQGLVLIFGARLNEGQSARMLPVNLTVMQEGVGEFYSTQGEDKCVFDEVTQTPLVGIPNRSRAYRIAVRGFCTEPARSLRGTGAILVSRFDFVGRVDYDETADD